MNWDLSMSWTRKTRTQTQIQEHEPRNYKKKKITTNRPQILNKPKNKKKKTRILYAPLFQIWTIY